MLFTFEMDIGFISTAYWVIEAEIYMKKINPKVVKVTIALMSVLLAGGAAVAVKEVLGGIDDGQETGLDGV